MYTNIDTYHVLSVIRRFLPVTPQNKAIMTALEIIKKHNFFNFGDTSWLQLTGTAMGTPPPPMYATLYFGIHEKETILRKYGRFFLLYKRYILMRSLESGTAPMIILTDECGEPSKLTSAGLECFAGKSPNAPTPPSSSTSS
jgi:hypothetical protein